jgi:hypothetical protein
MSEFIKSPVSASACKILEVLKLEIGNPAKQQPAAARTSHDVCI